MLTCTLDLSEFHRSVEQTEREMRTQIARGVNEAAEAGRDEAKRVGAWTDRTRRLRNGIAAVPAHGRGDGAESEILSPTPYSAIIEGGSRAHEIWARRKTFLRFVVGGQVIFARKVNHPGTRPYPFMGPAAIKADAVLRKVIANIPLRISRFWA